jgi:hypothetical protein
LIRLHSLAVRESRDLAQGVRGGLRLIAHTLAKTRAYARERERERERERVCVWKQTTAPGGRMAILLRAERTEINHKRRTPVPSIKYLLRHIRTVYSVCNRFRANLAALEWRFALSGQTHLSLEYSLSQSPIANGLNVCDWERTSDLRFFKPRRHGIAAF